METMGLSGYIAVVENAEKQAAPAAIAKKPHTRRKEGGEKTMAKKERKPRERKPITAEKLAVALAPLSAAERKDVVKRANKILKLASKLTG